MKLFKLIAFWIRWQCTPYQLWDTAKLCIALEDYANALNVKPEDAFARNVKWWLDFVEFHQIP